MNESLPYGSSLLPCRPLQNLGIPLTVLLTILGWIVPESGGASRTHARPIDVYLLAGQSNMAGADAVIVSPPGFNSTDADRRTLFTCAPITATESLDYHPWGEIKGHFIRSRASGNSLIHGPEVGFARHLHESGISDIAIVKVFANFTREEKEWPWGPDARLNRLWMAFVDARLEELRAKGFAPRVRGFLWYEGIDDAIQGELASVHRENLAALIDWLRARFHAPDAPFVIGRSVNSPIACRLTGAGVNDPMAIVRRAQVAVAESVPRSGWIDVDDLPNVAGHHFSAESQLTIGRRFASAYLKLDPASSASSARDR